MTKVESSVADNINQFEETEYIEKLELTKSEVVIYIHRDIEEFCEKLTKENPTEDFIQYLVSKLK